MAEEIVVYKRGKVSRVEKKLDPTLLQIVILDDLSVTLNKLNQHLAKQEFLGEVDPRELSVTDQVQVISLIHHWPFVPWISAYFFNDGPDEAYIAINAALDWTKLNKAEDALFNFAGSEQRIYIIYYKCDAGKTASVRMVGKY